MLSGKCETPTNRLGLVCSVSFVLPNQQGAMFRALSCFALRNLNVTKARAAPRCCAQRAPPASCERRLRRSERLSARPSLHQMTTLPLGGRKELGGESVSLGSGGTFSTSRWDYVFVVDFTASTNAAVNAAALDNLREFAAKVRILGEYNSAGSAARPATRTPAATPARRARRATTDPAPPPRDPTAPWRAQTVRPAPAPSTPPCTHGARR